MGGLQQHGRDLPVEIAAGRGRFDSAVRAIVLVFIAAWVVRSLVLTGGTILNKPIRSMLATAPGTVQAHTGSGFAQSLLPLQSLIPGTDRVYLVWDGPQDDGFRAYIFFWASYWLSPRPVAVSPKDAPADPSGYDTVLVVTYAPAPSRTQTHADLGGVTPDHVLSYPDGFTVSVYRRHPAHA